MKVAGKRTQLDQVDVEALTATMNSRGWRLIQLRTAHMLEAALRELEQDGDHEKTVATRAKVKALRAVLAIPDILLTEAKSGAAAQRQHEED